MISKILSKLLWNLIWNNLTKISSVIQELFDKNILNLPEDVYNSNVKSIYKKGTKIYPSWNANTRRHRETWAVANRMMNCRSKPWRVIVPEWSGPDDVTV